MKKCVFLADAWELINRQTDTSLYLMRMALELGCEVYYFNQNTLCSSAQAVTADVFSVHLSTESSLGLQLGEMHKAYDLSQMDSLWMRKDPPFDLEYIYATYSLDLLSQQGVRIINQSRSIRDANEKFFILNFPLCIPQTIVTSNMAVIYHFWEVHQDIILKPLDRMAGQNIFHVTNTGLNLPVILESLTSQGTVSIMAQRYLPEICAKGDKRIILISGIPLPYALARMPAKGDIRGNLYAGATGHVVPLTERDYWLCEQIAPVLIQKGLDFVGIDVIGDYITEINVTSPTGLVQIGAYLKNINDQQSMELISRLIMN